MDTVKLMNRQDTKYIFNMKKFASVMRSLSKFYRVLEINDKRLMSYGNVYYDTDDFKLYYEHQRGKLNRYKVRNRAYMDSNLAFCEVKFKNNKSRTDKNRIKIPELFKELNNDSQSFLEDNTTLEVHKLKCKLLMNFDRITLVHRAFKDRCTIDLNLKAESPFKEFSFDNLVIAEIKQEKFSLGSDFNKTLKSHGIYPGGFSKYCIALTKTYDGLKHNNFIPKIRKLEKIMNHIS